MKKNVNLSTSSRSWSWPWSWFCLLVPPPYMYLLSLGGRVVKNHATSSLFHYFFNIKFINFFPKTYFTKSVRNVKIAFLYIMKHVKILSYKVITLHFKSDIYVYIRGEEHIQLYVQLNCTVPNIQLF